MAERWGVSAALFPHSRSQSIPRHLAFAQIPLEDLESEREVEVYMQGVGWLCRASFIVSGLSFLFFFAGFGAIGVIKKYYKYPGVCVSVS